MTADGASLREDDGDAATHNSPHPSMYRHIFVSYFSDAEIPGE